MIRQLLKSLVPMAAMGLMFATSACGSAHMSFNDGVPLSELDMAGAAPTKLMLAGPDTVVVTEGPELAITITGSEAAKRGLRFELDDDTLAIGREDNWEGNDVATIAVTMPPLHEIAMAGSGKVTAPSLVNDAEVNVAGSGDIAIARVAANSLELNVMGSGTLSTAGTAERLDMNVAGSGQLKARGLKVGSADINIAGSGGGVFSSDGKVEARIAGSGNVTVYGRADCSINAMGSGTVRCRNEDAGNAGADEAMAAVGDSASPGASATSEASE